MCQPGTGDRLEQYRWRGEPPIGAHHQPGHRGNDRNRSRAVGEVEVERGPEAGSDQQYRREDMERLDREVGVHRELSSLSRMSRIARIGRFLRIAPNGSQRVSGIATAMIDVGRDQYCLG